MNGKSPIAHYPLLSKNKTHDQFLLLTNHGQFNLNSQFKNLDLVHGKHREPIVYIHPTSAAKKGLSNDSRVTIYNEHGEISLKCVFSNEVHPSILLVHADHNLVNKLISFTPTDMGEISSGFEGMAFNSIYVDIK